MKICADTGGTHIRLGYVDINHNVLVRKKYAVSEFTGGENGFIEALHKFLVETENLPNISRADVELIIISVAGRVKSGSVQFTNTDWTISIDGVQNEFSSLFGDDLKVLLLNDFEALAYGLSTVEENDVEAIFSREGYGDTKIICGPGTGLGLAALKQTGPNISDLTVIPSEGGHQSFPFEASSELEIKKHIMED